MSKFEESNFYKALQDFFINADKKTFLQFLAEFYNRTEGIIDKDNIQDDLIKELRELYLEFNEKGIDENIVREKVNYFVENNGKIKDIIAKLIINTNNIENVSSQLETITEKTLNKINALSIGFKNDGVSDNLQAINNFINNNSNTTLYFPNGTYCFSNSFDFKENLFIELDNKAELKLISQNNIDNFITLNLTKTQGYSYGNFIKGNGIINGNFKCDNLIGLSYYRHLNIDGVILKNFNKKGIITRQQGNTGGELKASNLLIQNEKDIIGSYGIYDNGHDNMFDNIIIQDVEVCLSTNSSQFNAIHGWISKSNLIETSVFAEINNANAVFNNCVIDTIMNGFKPTENHYSVMVNNLVVMFSTSVWGTPSNRHTLFIGNDETKYCVNNCRINVPFNIKFASLSTMYSSNFKNISIDKYTSSLNIENLIITNTNKELQGRGSLYNLDFNKCIVNGNFTVNPNWLNSPIANTYGVLTVMASGDWITQIYKPKSNYGNSLYIRVGKENDWGNWDEFKNTILSSSTVSNDANNCVFEGSYTTNPNWLNLPDTTMSSYGVLTVNQSGDFVMQIYKIKFNHDFYIRVGKKGDWENWTKFTGVNIN